MTEVPIISLHSFRGGVGKTIIATNLAYSIALELNKKVLLIDFDIVASNLSFLLQLQSKKVINQYIKEEIELNSLIQQIDKNIALIPATQEDQLLYLEKKAWINTFSRIILDLEELIKFQNYDLVIIDNHPAIIQPTIAAMALSTTVLWCMRADFMSMTNFINLLTKKQFREMLSQKNSGVVLNMVFPKYTNHLLELRNKIEDYFPIYANIPFSEPLFLGLDDSLFICKIQPEHPISKSIRDLAKNLLQTL